MKRRILLLTHRVPHPPNRGDRIRAWQMLQYLSRENDVYLASPADEPVSRESQAELARHCAEFHTPPLGRLSRWKRGAWAACSGRPISQGMFAQPALQNAIERWQRAQPFDAAIVYCSTMFPYVEGPLWHRVPKLVDLIDVDSRKWQDFAHGAQGWRKQLYQREANAVAKLERRIVQRADAVTVTTAVEAQILREVTLEACPLVIPNGVELPPQESTPAASIPGRLAFVGVLDYRPNVDGIVWFVEQVWPRIIATHPHATLEIVGRNPTTQVSELGRVRGITVVANPPVISPHLQAAEIVIAPLHIARGVQNKVLEALAQRRATIVTSAACQGLTVTAGQQFAVANGADAWQAAVQQLLDSPARRTELAEAGFAYVQEHHQWEACLAPLGDWLQEVCPRELTPSRQRTTGALIKSA